MSDDVWERAFELVSDKWHKIERLPTQQAQGAFTAMAFGFGFLTYVSCRMVPGVAAAFVASTSDSNVPTLKLLMLLILGGVLLLTLFFGLVSIGSLIGAFSIAGEHRRLEEYRQQHQRATREAEVSIPSIFPTLQATKEQPRCESTEKPTDSDPSVVNSAVFGDGLGNLPRPKTVEMLVCGHDAHDLSRFVLIPKNLAARTSRPEWGGNEVCASCAASIQPELIDAAEEIAVYERCGSAMESIEAVHDDGPVNDSTQQGEIPPLLTKKRLLAIGLFFLTLIVLGLLDQPTYETKHLLYGTIESSVQAEQLRQVGWEETPHQFLFEGADWEFRRKTFRIPFAIHLFK